MLKGEKQNDKLVHLKKILPPFNSSAKNPQNIYKIENLMVEKDSIDTTNVMNAIEEYEETGGNQPTSLIIRNFEKTQDMPLFIRFIKK
jgi:hypothetical protein